MKSKRSKSRYPGLDKTVNLKIRRELLDQDYISKLSPEEKQWLSNFNEEYVSANFQHDGKRIHPKKFKSKKVKSTGKTRKIDVAKNECETRNNARNADTFAVTSSNGMLKGENKVSEGVNNILSTNHDEVEDVLITVIDLKNKLGNSE